MVTVEEEDFTTENLKKLDAKYQPTQVVIEHNGMWQIVESQEKFPQHWQLYQVVTIIESTTFNSYAKNMASLMMEKLRLADLIVFNRCTDELAPMLRQRNVKLLNRRAEIYLEFNEERMEEYDDGSVCPFDLSQPVLELSDSDFGFWYTDCMDKPDRYEGKTVRFRGMVAQSPRFPRGSFAVGRFAMVCCAEDTAFMGLLCYGGDQKRLSITKAGNTHVRRLLVEAAQSYGRGKAGYKSKALKDRQEGNPPRVIAYADRANERLRRKYYSMLFRGKRANVAKTALARELACFIWGMMNEKLA
jgi:hypothetical protein